MFDLTLEINQFSIIIMHLNKSYNAFEAFLFFFIVLSSIVVHVKGLYSEEARSPHQRELLFPTENSASVLLQMSDLESNLYFHNVCVSHTLNINHKMLNTGEMSQSVAKTEHSR